jgi:cardiolipin synthase
VTLPNIISLGRLLAVPLVVWLLLADAHLAAFWVFALAGVSDALDGFIAKRFNQASVLGRYLDPLADKALLVSIYISLGVQDVVPLWLVIIVVSRDILIVGAVLLSFTLEQAIPIRPLLISKINTLAQLALAGWILAGLGFALPASQHGFDPLLFDLVAITTVLSGGSYLVSWLRSMGAIGKAS